MGMNGNQADRAFGRERAELFRHARACKTETAPSLGWLDCHKIAVLGIGSGTGRDRKLATKLFLFDRQQAPAASGQGVKNTEDTLLGTVDELDDPPAVPDRIAFVPALLHPQQSPISDPGSLAGPSPSGDTQANSGRRILVGIAINSPSLSRPVMSASTTWGNVPG
jgi:hypothetical protein